MSAEIWFRFLAPSEDTFVYQINVLRSYYAIKITLFYDDLFFNKTTAKAVEWKIFMLLVITVCWQIKRERKKDRIYALTGDRERDHENGIEKRHRGTSLASFFQKIAEYYSERRSWPERRDLEKKINLGSFKYFFVSK